MKIDCTNLECPKPVLETKKALENLDSNSILDVVVDNEAAKQNVARFAKSQNCKVEIQKNGSTFILSIAKGFTCQVSKQTNSSFYDKILFLKDDKIGEGELGLKLIQGFLSSILELPKLPKQIFCVNRAVLLTAGENNEILQILKSLAEKGVQIYSCGVCLEFYGLKNSLKVGEIGNAYSTLEALFNSGETVSL